MLVYRPVLPHPGPDVATRMMTIEVSADGTFWINPSGLPAAREALDGTTTRAFLPTADTMFGVPPNAVVTLTLVPYDASGHVCGYVHEYLFVADRDQPPPPPEPGELGVAPVREDD